MTGVRLLVAVGDDGAELAGTLRANAPVNDEDAPGDPLPKGALGPVTLTATSAPGWIDLALTTPHQLSARGVVWLELQVARGSLVWKLAEPSTLPSDNAVLGGARRPASTSSLSTFDDVGDYAAALRVVGQERPNQPLAALRAAVAGGDRHRLRRSDAGGDDADPRGDRAGVRAVAARGRRRRPRGAARADDRDTGVVCDHLCRAAVHATMSEA